MRDVIVYLAFTSSPVTKPLLMRNPKFYNKQYFYILPNKTGAHWRPALGEFCVTIVAAEFVQILFSKLRTLAELCRRKL